MALFIGGPADGWRIAVDPSLDKVDVPINPVAPAFTPDSAVLSARTSPAYRYKKQTIVCQGCEYDAFVPNDWDCQRVLEALVLGYKQSPDLESRLNYIRTANGVMYDQDDRDPAGRPYRI